MYRQCFRMCVVLSLAAIIYGCIYGCTQISGLSEYSKSDEVIGSDSTDTGSGDGGTDGQQSFCEPGCDDAMRGNGNCDAACRNVACGFDDGDCDNEYCVDGCRIGTINDGACNPPCNVDECDHDGGDCGDSIGCPPGCLPSMIGNGECNYNCLGGECGNDGGDCDDVNECSPGCQNVLLANGECNDICNTDSCFRDNGDCVSEVNPGCDGSDVDCSSQCAPCARANNCMAASEMCNNNYQCIKLQDCVSVNCDHLLIALNKERCVSDCFNAHPDGVVDFDMMRYCIYCTGCPESCAADYGEFCANFNLP